MQRKERRLIPREDSMRKENKIEVIKERTTPEEMKNFQKTESKELINVIPDFEAMPIAVGLEKRRGDDLKPDDMHYSFRGGPVHRVITPAWIGEEGNRTMAFPHIREEHVLIALKLLAVTQGEFYNGHFGLKCTLYEISEQLRKQKTAYIYEEIKEAITILLGCGFSYKRTGKKMVVFDSFSLITSLRITHEIGTDINFEGEMFFHFPPIVTKGILNQEFRPFYYSRYLEYKSKIARTLYRHLSLSFRQAGVNKEGKENKFGIYAVNIIELARKKAYKTFSNNITQIKIALKEMEEAGHIQTRWEESIKIIKEGRKVVDAFITIYATEKLIKEIKEANFYEGQNEEERERESFKRRWVDPITSEKRKENSQNFLKIKENLAKKSKKK